MSNVRVRLLATINIATPGGSVFGGYGFSINGGVPTVVQPTNTVEDDGAGNQINVIAEYTFVDVAPGEGTVGVVLLGADGAELSPVVSEAYTVPVPTVDLPAPATITVALQ